MGFGRRARRVDRRVIDGRDARSDILAPEFDGWDLCEPCGKMWECGFEAGEPSMETFCPECSPRMPAHSRRIVEIAQ